MAQGGTHGDFLYKLCQIMISDENENKINNNGRVIEDSIFKKKNIQFYEKGIKKIAKGNLGNARQIEICHIWYEEFMQWPCKFYYIDFDDSLIEIIKKMYLEKVCNNDNSIVIKNYIRYLPDNVAKKINLNNFDKIITNSYKSIRKKYQKQPDAKPINITDLYSLDKVKDILKDMEIYNDKKLELLEIFHKDWIGKNNKWINIIKNS